MMRQLSDELTQGGCRKSSDKIQMLLAHGFQIERNAHAVIKDKDCLLKVVKAVDSRLFWWLGRKWYAND